MCTLLKKYVSAGERREHVHRPRPLPQRKANTHAHTLLWGVKGNVCVFSFSEEKAIGESFS